ncbi:P-loop containing nucleoside triphosphate hydrolase protein [Pholiota conissans]|uniref:DNA 3'-5' helicase n=1 Tax=Pholiota conissans TaxID=109636 RepID=A0A9P5ZH14_9AGAR|nr:P-loop containing nucleoside triphosphate hydrolase protein [Pholiota conissans]
MAEEILSYDVPTLTERLQFFRTCSDEAISELSLAIKGLHERLPQEYLAGLQSDDLILCLRVSLISWSTTGGEIVPRVIQLKDVLGDRRGRSTLVSAGTGSGKSIPMALNILLDDPRQNLISITVSPLKRLQASQVDYFMERFGIRTFAINEDTPRDEAWWTKNIYSTSKPTESPVQLLIVTIEQLSKTPEGHYPRMACFVRDPKFQKRIARMNIDEAHSFGTQGLPLYGQPAFRPAWGQLTVLKVVIPPSANWHLYSATYPLHIFDCIVDKLLRCSFDYIYQTSNRPNIMYATHQVPGKLDDVRNYECFLRAPYNPASQPHVLIFVDDKALVARIASHLDGCLPSEYRGKGVVKHYHSSMSKLYLERTHADFISPTGTCKILVATSGQSVGIDFPNVQIVCQVGLPATIVDAIQRGGRAIRTGNETALFVVFHEEWALNIKEDEYPEGIDPDRPRADLRSNSRAQERAPLSGIRLAQCTICLRQFYADYLNDQTAAAMEYTGPFCCDRHNDGFDLQAFLPGILFRGNTSVVNDEVPPPATTSGEMTMTRTIKKKNRSKPERLLLEPHLIEWLDIQVANDPAKRPAYEILSTEQTKTLLSIASKDITSASAIVEALDETDEWMAQWGDGLFRLIFEFDMQIQSSKAAQKRNKPRAKRAGSPVEMEFAVVHTAESYKVQQDANEAAKSNKRSIKKQKTTL